MEARREDTLKEVEYSGWTPRAGDWVEVRAVEEIMRTLDERGDFERMPFMPEMLGFAGQRFQVSAVAHKTCDTVNKTGGRAIKNAVHLADLRCDGSAHGGCQAACLLFWKTAWLRPVKGAESGNDAPVAAPAGRAGETGTLARNAASIGAEGETVYRCQATTLPEWSTLLHWWDVRQYWRDVRSRNVTARVAARVLFLAGVRRMLGLPYGTRLWRACLDYLHRRFTGRSAPFGRGTIPKGQPTPDLRTNLRPGERVRLKDHEAILATVNNANLNRGLSFDPEMSVYCGGEYVVADRVERIVNEKTGRMMHFTNPCIRLEGVVCKAWYSQRRHLCPRRITSYFREIWLERVDQKTIGTASQADVIAQLAEEAAHGR